MAVLSGIEVALVGFDRIYGLDRICFELGCGCFLSCVCGPLLVVGLAPVP